MNKKMSEETVFGICPKCKRNTVEGHKYSESIYTWFLCREFGLIVGTIQGILTWVLVA